LSASDQAVKGLRGLLGDPSYVVDLRERSLLQNVPDDALWSLLTVIGFQQDALAEEYYPLHKDVEPPTVSELWEMFAPFPTDDPLPEVLRERWRVVSSPVGDVESPSLKVLQSNTEGSSSSDRGRTVRLLALDGLIEADTQIGNTDRARTSLESLRNLIAPSTDRENARFDILAARVEAAAGSGERAREIAHSLPSALPGVLLAEAGRIFQMTGSQNEAKNVFEELSPAERPAY
jgi:hypothetical protein